MSLTLSILFSRRKQGSGERSSVLDASNPEPVIRIRSSEVYVEVLLIKNAVANTRPGFVRIGDGNFKMLEQL